MATFISGYIYIRNHCSYNIHNAYKLGKTNNIYERDSQYATGEIQRGFFELVLEVPIKLVNIIENMLKHNFKKYNIRLNGGTEFFNKKIIDKIEHYLSNLNIKYKKLSPDDIKQLLVYNKIRNIFKKINYKSLKLLLNNNKPSSTPIYNQRPYQTGIIKKSIEYFKLNDKGLLILMCGIGKTLISLWITLKLKCNTILIGVPNKLLLEQWEYNCKILFPDMPYLIVSGGINITQIKDFLKIHNKKCIIITTYSSSFKIYNSAFMFDIKILDEVHHLTSSNSLSTNNKDYVEILKIKSLKQLSLTATIKNINTNNPNIISNDNINIFGNIIEKKNLYWAIQNNIICDYIVQTILTSKTFLEEKFKLLNIIDENDKRLFLSAFISLKSIFNNNSHHILIYCNNTKNSNKIIKYINILLKDKYFTIIDLYYSSYNSKYNNNDKKYILSKFKKSQFGILTCVYCLGEGWDLPKLDTVVFAENMTSNIRIVQSALRASRKNKDEPDKITKIILPILVKKNLLDKKENNDLNKIKEIIYQLGLEDENISQKISVLKLNKIKSNIKQSSLSLDLNKFGIYDDALTKQIKINIFKRTDINISYEKAREIISNYNIKDKNGYYKLCKVDYRLPEKPEIIYKKQFINWIEYLNLPNIYYNLDTCKIMVETYLNKYPYLKNHYLDLTYIINKLCEIDKLFPPVELWKEYYSTVNLNDIIVIVNKKRSL
jgi:superfamily II DNA or RNA helicase